jgi:hypothetical protein
MRLKKIAKEGLHNLYYTPNIIRRIKSRRIKWARPVACMGGEWSSYTILIGKPEGKRPLGRLRCRWKENTKLVRKELVWGYLMDYSNSA